jgi:GNAT superfamily N-acetyltransferase
VIRELAERTTSRAALYKAHYGDLAGRFDRRTWCAEESGEVVGTATIGPPRDDFGPWVGEVYELRVNPAHRRRGVGSALHDTVVRTWRDLGITVGVLELRADDQAREFYESHGWTPDGHTRQSLDGTRYLRLRRAIN